MKNSGRKKKLFNLFESKPLISNLESLASKCMPLVKKNWSLETFFFSRIMKKGHKSDDGTKTKNKLPQFTRSM